VASGRFVAAAAAALTPECALSSLAGYLSYPVLCTKCCKWESSKILNFVAKLPVIRFQLMTTPTIVTVCHRFKGRCETFVRTFVSILREKKLVFGLKLKDRHDTVWIKN
jgi:hypothetical protein